MQLHPGMATELQNKKILTITPHDFSHFHDFPHILKNSDISRFSLQYGDGAGNTAEENSSICSIIRMR